MSVDVRSTLDVGDCEAYLPAVAMADLQRRSRRLRGLDTRAGRKRYCVVCFCSDETTCCPNGCVWVKDGWDFCSSCLSKAEARFASLRAKGFDFGCELRSLERMSIELFADLRSDEEFFAWVASYRDGRRR